MTDTSPSSPGAGNAAALLTSLGRYQVIRLLGQGAMGAVYEALDTRLNRPVAIKTVLRSHLMDETTAADYAQRFEREAQAAARLSHPNVVAVYDFGEHKGISYIVMELVRGRELRQAFEEGERFALPEVVRLMRELLLALDAAHQQGVVHRDIKPANVMLDHGGHVKLTDFGVARLANTLHDRTLPGTLVGTPSYMAPEQILGQAVGSRADIFAAGVVLYQFLTGRRPFGGKGAFDLQRAIVQDEVAPPSQLDPTLNPKWDAIVVRALAKNPERRYVRAADFADDLLRLLPPVAPEVAVTLADDDATVVRPVVARPRNDGVAMGKGTATAPAPPSQSAPQPALTTATTATTATTFATAPPAPAPAAKRRPLGIGWLGGLLAVGLLVALAWMGLGRSPTSPPTSAMPVPATTEPAQPMATPSTATSTMPPTTPSTAPSAVPSAATAAPGAAVRTTPAILATQVETDVAAPAIKPVLPATRADGVGMARSQAKTVDRPAVKPDRGQRPSAPAKVEHARSEKPAPSAADKPSTASSRCADLSLRLQIGEPLSAEQNAYFQSRCTR